MSRPRKHKPAGKDDLRYFIAYKPFGYLSRFMDEGNYLGLKRLFHHLPSDVYAVGRLDAESEGLMILTNDKKLNQKILKPENKLPKTYLVQVEGQPEDEDLQPLRDGLEIKINRKIFHTQPARASLAKQPDWLPERVPPVRYRKNVPSTWLSITLTEGKNRQVRKMTAKIGYPTLRLVRIAIEELSLKGLQPGKIMRLKKEMTYNKLGLELSNKRFND